MPYCIKILLILSFLLFQGLTFADAFLQKEGKLLAINSIYLSRFQQTNPETGGVSSHHVGSLYLSHYVEYGFSSRITIGFKFAFQEFFQDNKGDAFGNAKLRSSSFEGLQLFSRVMLFERDFFVVSIFSAVKFRGAYLNKGSLYNEFGATLYDEFQGGLEFGFSMEQDPNTQLNSAQRPFVTLALYYNTNIYLWQESRMLFTLGLPIHNSVVLFFKLAKINYFFRNMSQGGSQFANFLYFNGSPFAIAELYSSILFRITDECLLEFGYRFSIHTGLLRTINKQYNLHGLFCSFWLYF